MANDKRVHAGTAPNNVMVDQQITTGLIRNSRIVDWKGGVGDSLSGDVCGGNVGGRTQRADVGVGRGPSGDAPDNEQVCVRNPV